MSSKSISVSLMVLLCLLSLLTSCGGSSDSTANDSLTIDSLSPSVVSSNTSTTFTLSVSYSLQTKDSGIIQYGFRGISSSQYALEPDSKIVSKGTGTATFTTTKSLTENNVVYVLLSENPHASPWSPLASTSQTITVN